MSPLQRQFRGPARLAAKRAAFTLVELLIVIAILALLIGILLPVLSTAREEGRRVVCMNNLRQLDIGFLMYAQNNRGYFPATAIAGPIYNDWIYWQMGRGMDKSAIAPYVSHIHSNQATPHITSIDLSIFHCPADDFYAHVRAPSGYTYSYAMNALVGTGYFFPHGTVAKLSQFRNPSSKFLVCEEDAATIDDGHCDPRFPGSPNLLGLRHDRTVKGLDLPTGATTYKIIPHPRGRGNVGFADGSVRYTTRQEFHRAFCWQADLPAP